MLKNSNLLIWLAIVLTLLGLFEWNARRVGSSEDGPLNQLSEFTKNGQKNFDLIIIGSSKSQIGFDIYSKTNRVLNLSRGNQDLYYNYSLLKFYLAEGYISNNLLIDISPWTFYFSTSERVPAIAASYYWNFGITSTQLNPKDYLYSTSVYLANRDYVNNNFFGKSIGSPFHNLTFKRFIQILLKTLQLPFLEKNKFNSDCSNCQFDYLNQIYRLCEEKKIKITLIYMPVQNDAYSREEKDKMNYYVYTFLKSHKNVNFLDFSGLLKNEFFSDNQHLNDLGKNIFSKIFTKKFNIK